VNLALPFFGFSEPIVAMKNKYGTTEWTLWDRFVFKSDPTLKDIITWFQKEHQLDISMVSQGVSMLWSSFVGKKKVGSPSVVPIACDCLSLTFHDVDRVRNVCP
jgi:ubiquitin-activating enzyme E1